jgi:hypothetical protein
MKNSYFQIVFYFLLATFVNASFGQDKIFLKCEGSTKIVSSAEINQTLKESNSPFKSKPMTLMVVIGGTQISVNDYEIKDIPSTFAEKPFFKTEYGGLDIKDTYYDGYRTIEQYRHLKDSSDNTDDKRLYFYQNTRFILNRLNGDFTWRLTYYGNSWINDLLPVKAKDKYVNLEVEGKCKKDAQKVLF